MALADKNIVRRSQRSGHALPSGLHPVLTRIYLARDLTQAEELDNSFEQLLAPDLLAGIENAVALLIAALENRQKIVIIADYDTDGATSCALAVTALRRLGADQVSYLVPDRFNYGYGLTPEIVKLALAKKPDLLVTVDNGIASIDGVNTAQEHGVKVLITDHHLPGAQLPGAAAIVNPNQPGDSFPSKNLAGVGVIFYVMLALRKRLREAGWFKSKNIDEPNFASLLDLVALGTVADLVPLDHNNRILVAQGLARINQGQCIPGIRALCQISKREIGSLSASDLGFSLAPRLNAAGRLKDMTLGVECLLSSDDNEALGIARQLDQLNQERRLIQDDMQQQANQAINKLNVKTTNLPGALCLFDESWHQGVIGLVASRIKDQVHRPVIAFAPGGEGIVKGSARSIPGLHIRDTLDSIASSYPEMLHKFGGHAMAAGLTLKTEYLEDFEKIFVKEVNQRLAKEDLEHNILSDGELEASAFDLEFAEILRKSGPWGQAFPEPVFDGQFEVINQRVVGDRHLKMVLRPEKGRNPVDAIAFNLAPEGRAPDWQIVRAAYKLDVNEYRGRRSLQLVIDYLEPMSIGRNGFSIAPDVL